MSNTEVSNAVLVEVGPGEDTKPSDISEVTEVSEEPQDVDMKRRHALSKLKVNVLDTRIYSTIMFFIKFLQDE